MDTYQPTCYFISHDSGFSYSLDMCDIFSIEDGDPPPCKKEECPFFIDKYKLKEGLIAQKLHGITSYKSIQNRLVDFKEAKNRWLDKRYSNDDRIG